MRTVYRYIEGLYEISRRKQLSIYKGDHIAANTPTTPRPQARSLTISLHYSPFKLKF